MLCIFALAYSSLLTLLKSIKSFNTSIADPPLGSVIFFQDVSEEPWPVRVSLQTLR